MHASTAALAPPTPAAQPERRLFEVERACMGTRCTIAAFHDDEAEFDQAVNRALAEIARLDAMMTTWTESSEVSRINAGAGSGDVVALSPETYQVLDRSLWIARESGGAFDITIGAFKGLWKFDEDNDGSLPRRADVLARLPLVDYRGLLLDPKLHTARLAKKGQSITLGGIAKGLIVDHAVAKLRDSGLRDFLVQAGGDMYAAGRRGDRPWRVGIQDPRAGGGQARSADTSFALISLEDSAFNTSGDYERFVIKDGKRYHHIIDPRTGYPVAHTRSVTVLAPTSFLADTLDTAVFVLGAEKGLELIARVPGAEAVIVDAHNQLHMSPGLKERLQLTRPPTDAP
ncbi:MAG TPA: FAD:protein FMN transferase [Polyangiaceae bacterium]|nr:FAD:protein FMN transferase [Polyangiaceae bacterium]